MTIEELNLKLKKCYSEDTCYPKMKEQWNIQNSSMGHCAIVSLIINDYFGGLIGKCIVNGISHYFNIINNKIIDLTSEQFKIKNICYNNYIIKTRLEILKDKDTLERYKRLNNRLQILIDKE